MLNKVDVGWTVLFNDYSGSKCPAIVTKVYDISNKNSDLDLHVIGIKSNASYSRGKLKVSYGVETTGCWEYSSQREVRITTDDLPIDGEGLIYKADIDAFSTEPIESSSNIQNVDGGTF